MGDNAHNHEHRVHVGPGVTDGEHYYHLHYGSINLDVRSPGMDLGDATLSAVLAAAGQGETAWLAEMPTAVSAWMATRTSGERSGLRDVDVKMAAALAR